MGWLDTWHCPNEECLSSDSVTNGEGKHCPHCGTKLKAYGFRDLLKLKEDKKEYKERLKKDLIEEFNEEEALKILKEKEDNIKKISEKNENKENKKRSREKRDEEDRERKSKNKKIRDEKKKVEKEKAGWFENFMCTDVYCTNKSKYNEMGTCPDCGNELEKLKSGDAGKLSDIKKNISKNKKLILFHDQLDDDEIRNRIFEDMKNLAYQETGTKWMSMGTLLSFNSTEQIIGAGFKAIIDQNKLIIRQNELLLRELKKINKKNQKEKPSEISSNKKEEHVDK